MRHVLSSQLTKQLNCLVELHHSISGCENPVTYYISKTILSLNTPQIMCWLIRESVFILLFFHQDLKYFKYEGNINIYVSSSVCHESLLASDSYLLYLSNIVRCKLLNTTSLAIAFQLYLTIRGTTRW